MSADYGAWVLLLEVLQQLKKGELLLGCASVLGILVVSGASTDIAHANGIGVVPFAVGAGDFDGATLTDGSVKVDDVVITDLGETA